MGASAQQILQSDPEYLRRQLQAQEAQRVNPTGSAAGALGALLGRGISNVSQGKGFFETPDYGLKRVSGVQGIMQSVQFDPKNPAKYYEEVGAALQQAGYSDLAPLAFQEARKSSLQDTEIELKKERLSFDRQRLQADLAKEARQGRFTDAQIRQIDAQIANLGNTYEYEVIKGPAGETTSIVAINKKNPSDVRTINLSPTDTTTPPAATSGEWNYVPGQGMVKAP